MKFTLVFYNGLYLSVRVGGIFFSRGEGGGGRGQDEGYPGFLCRSEPLSASLICTSGWDFFFFFVVDKMRVTLVFYTGLYLSVRA